MRLIIFFMILCVTLTGCNTVDTSETKQNGLPIVIFTIKPYEALITPEVKPLNKPDEAQNIKVGDYVQFGKYYGDPILWKCVKKEDGSPMLVSEYILCLKAFDAAESGIDSVGSDDVQKFGSNKWSSSNIKEWLNSEGKVNYTTQAPVKGSVNENEYADEPGFLSNFSSLERDLVKPVDHDGVTDKVYLLSDDELALLRGEIAREPTNKAIQNSSYKDLKFSVGIGYWTRTPSTVYLTTAHFVSPLGYIGESVVNGGTVGILPVINLKSDMFTSGKGTKAEPYKLL